MNSFYLIKHVMYAIRHASASHPYGRVPWQDLEPGSWVL
jgi:hypothetical protein